MVRKELLEHNQETVNSIENFIRQDQNCCVINPCGSGKTSVMAAFIKNHPDKTFVILTKQKNAEKYYRQSDDVFCADNILIRTYNKMHRDVINENYLDYKADFYLADEAHYLGAEKWKQSFQVLIDKWSPILVGFTATPQRFEDQSTNHTIVDDFFDGNKAGNFTVTALEERGVFVKPEYVFSVYDMQTVIDKHLVQIADSDVSEKNKEFLYAKLSGLYKEWEKEGQPSVIFNSYLPKYMYKEECNRILVYVSSMKEIYEKQKAVDDLIKGTFPDKEIKSYIYTYQTPETMLDEFLTEDDTYIKVLYSIDKIMETIHIPDLRITVMLRPSVSNRIITQQFGRNNSIGNTNRPLIIDMVGNLERLKSGQYEPHPHKQKGVSNAHQSITMPYIRKALNVFQTIDRTIKGLQTYTYKGFTGTLDEICFVYHRNADEVKNLLKDHDIETAIELSCIKKILPSLNVIDGINTLPEFTMTEEQKEYANQHIGVFNRFIERRQISDEDLLQDLYIYFCYAVTKNWDHRTEMMTTRLISSMHRCYLASIKVKKMQEEHLCCLDEKTLQYNSDDYYDNRQLRKRLEEALSTLSDRESMVMTERFGLIDGHESSFKEIGKLLGVTGNRISQINSKALRKLKHPYHSKSLEDYRSTRCDMMPTL